MAKDVRFTNLTRVDPVHVYLAPDPALQYPSRERIDGIAALLDALARAVVVPVSAKPGVDPFILCRLNAAGC